MKLNLGVLIRTVIKSEFERKQLNLLHICIAIYVYEKDIITEWFLVFAVAKVIRRLLVDLSEFRLCIDQRIQ